MPNIFLNDYQQPENRLTYNFLTVLDYLNSGPLMMSMLGRSDLAEPPIVKIDTVYGGGLSNPDGSFALKLDGGGTVVVYLEVKTRRLGLTPLQLQTHLQEYVQDDDQLLVITPRKSDQKICNEVNRNIVFRTWAEVAGMLSEFSEDRIVSDFLEYGERKGEFEIVGPLNLEDINAVVSFNKSKFFTKVWALLEDAKDALPFGEHGIVTTDISIRDNWGRLGYEISLPKTKAGQWIFFGLYYDTYDHKIALKKAYTPELAFFLDVDKDFAKKSIDSDAALAIELESLERIGFQNNLKGKISNNRWRLLNYRVPITDFSTVDSREMLKFVHEVLISLDFARNKKISELVGFKSVLKSNI